MQPVISIVLIDQDNGSRTAIRELIQQYGEHIKLLGSTADFDEGYRLIQAVRPSIVILGVTRLDVGVEQIRQITSHYAHTAVFANTTHKDPDWIIHLIHAGGVEYLLKPLDKENLFEAFRKVEKLLMTNRAEVRPADRGLIISVYNPIGGMGTTTIAVNLAVALSQKKSSIALIDLNLFSGDIATFLNLTPRYTLSSVTSNLPRLDKSFLMGVMPRHSSGVYLLCEPLEVEEAISVTPEQILEMLTFLKQLFSSVIIDTGGQLSGVNESIFLKSDLILFTTVLSLPALKNAKRYLAAMDKHGLPMDRVRVVVNRYLTGGGITVADAEKVLDRRIFLTIPNEYEEVCNSINKGTPVVELYSGSEVTKALYRLAGLVSKALAGQEAV